jgi:hypothetical protein
LESSSSSADCMLGRSQRGIRIHTTFNSPSLRLFTQFKEAGQSRRLESPLGAIVHHSNELYDIVSLHAVFIMLQFCCMWSQFLDCLHEIFEAFCLFFVSSALLTIDSFGKPISSDLRVN